MLKRNWLGDKTGQGFYKRVKGSAEKEILTLDVGTMEYRPRAKARFASIEAGKAVEDTRERLRTLITPLFEGQKTDKAQQFIWGGLSETCSLCRAAYSRNLRPHRRYRPRDEVGLCVGAWPV